MSAGMTAAPGTEELESGLRLQIAPLAFFQASTDAAEGLFRAVGAWATRGGAAFPARPCCDAGWGRAADGGSGR